MRRMLILWGVEWKHMMKLLPAMLSEAALLLVLLGGIAFGAAKLFYQDYPLVQITIAVVEEEENLLTDLVIQYVEEMESTSQSCRFLLVGRDEGFRMLEEGNAAAVLLMPAGVVEGIIHGNNVPVQVYFPKNAGVESGLLKELTDAGMRMLRVAQAQIYSIYDTAKMYGALDQVAVLEAEVNRNNLAFALDRLALFTTKGVSSTGSLSMLQYGIVSGAVLFLLLLGMACYALMKPYPKEVGKLLQRQGLGIFAQCFSKWLCGLAGMGSVFAGVWLLLQGIARWFDIETILPIVNGRNVWIVGLILLCAVSYVFFLFQLAANESAAVLLLFFLSTVMMYFSGGFVPSVFLPETVRKIGSFLPTAYLLKMLGSLYTNVIPYKEIGALIAYTLAFWAASYGIWRKGA